MSEDWKEGVFGCCNNVSTCIFGLFCPCWLYGKNQEKLDGQSCLQHCLLYAICGACVCCFHGPRRAHMRQKYNLKPDCNDYLVTYCCSPCAVCQESREMEVRGPPPQQSM